MSLFGCLILGLVLLFLGLVITPFVFMVLWNFVVPTVFNGPTLDFWQAFAIVFLLEIIGSAFDATSSHVK